MTLSLSATGRVFDRPIETVYRPAHPLNLAQVVMFQHAGAAIRRSCKTVR